MEHRHKRRPWPIPRLHERLLVLSQGRISCTSRDCGAESVGDIIWHVIHLKFNLTSRLNVRILRWGLEAIQI
ncbi:hypothetical protein SUGI_1134790 [Cryptomeria japonica]|nr:hypothetical protein SUGI_1134790 [Cryptomeria japonica]